MDRAELSRRINIKPDETKLKTLALTLGSLTGMSGSDGAFGAILKSTVKPVTSVTVWADHLLHNR